MEPDDSVYLKGQFLIAMPGLEDPNFHQTVTCIVEHNADGAVGIVINRIHQLVSAEDIFKELDIDYHPDAAGIPIYLGGPVHTGEIFILHGPPFEWQGTLSVTEQLAMSNTIDLLEAIAQVRGPKAFLIAMGCAGWAPGQLEAEIKQNAWLTGPSDETLLFSSSVEKRWMASMERLGIRPELLSGAAGNA